MVAGRPVSMLDAVVRTRFGDAAVDAERGVDAEEGAAEAAEEAAGAEAAQGAEGAQEAGAAAAGSAAAEVEAAAEVGTLLMAAGAARAAEAKGAQEQAPPSSSHEPAKKRQKTAAPVELLTPRYGLCGTPNCFLKDFHAGPCQGQEALGRRRSSLATCPPTRTPHPTK